jgi:hypothetical protein
VAKATIISPFIGQLKLTAIDIHFFIPSLSIAIG